VQLHHSVIFMFVNMCTKCSGCGERLCVCACVRVYVYVCACLCVNCSLGYYMWCINIVVHSVNK
jgi:hypothetical protein